LSRCVTFRKELERALGEWEVLIPVEKNDWILNDCLSWRQRMPIAETDQTLAISLLTYLMTVLGGKSFFMMLSSIYSLTMLEVDWIAWKDFSK
jgi:hypothetical protein